MKIPITKPFFDEAEKEAGIKPLETGWVVQGPYVAEFEGMFAEYMGVQYAKATTSCTTALHMALIACGVSKGDEVILPAFTYVASANAVEYTGAKPVFVDIDLKTFNMDTDHLEQAITHKTKAIMPIHLFGLCADMGSIMDIAGSCRLSVVEDAACAVGSLYMGKSAGSFGDVGCFSFHPRKLITTGEGGMLTTNSECIASLVDALRSHGATISDEERHNKGAFILPEHNILGYNYRMTDLQGAIGVQQMKKLDWILKRRIELAHRYDEFLRDMEGIDVPSVPEGYRHTYQSYVIFIRENLPLSRDELALKLQSRGISTRQGTHAVHTLGFYSNKYHLSEWDFPMSRSADRQTLTLPLYPQMTEEEQEYVIDNIKKTISQRHIKTLV
jgi:dTDP-4-amino-4,6-dideoxygalactose transaminase